MNAFPRIIAAVTLSLVGLSGISRAADKSAPASAADLAARLSAVQEDGKSFVRLRMEVKQGSDTKATYQLQLKQRRSNALNELVYQVLWPREQKGESVLLRQPAGHAASGTLLTPPDKLQPLDASKMSEPLFGSDLSYGDAIENFFAWPSQTLAGTETVNGVSCQILESKPGRGGISSYAKVRSWIDAARLVPLKVEKYSAGGQLLRRIETTDVDRDDTGRPVPSKFVVKRPGADTVTLIEGSRIKHAVVYADKEFQPAGMGELTAPRSAAQ